MNSKERKAYMRQIKQQGEAAAAQRSSEVEQSPDEATANTKLADVARKISAKAKSAKSIAGLPDLPKLPKGQRKSKPPKPCECGCNQLTRGGRFIPGHDARLHGWALRVERGLLKASEVPAPHTEAVKALLKTKNKAAKAKAAVPVAADSPEADTAVE